MLKFSHMQHLCRFHLWNATWFPYGSSDRQKRGEKMLHPAFQGKAWQQQQQSPSQKLKMRGRDMLHRPAQTHWLHVPHLTHHRPGLPLAVSQKKWLKRSLVLKLLSMIAEWEHGAPGLPTHDCSREPLIPCHMTCSPIIPSGSHCTWSKWAKSQRLWMEAPDAVDGTTNKSLNWFREQENPPQICFQSTSQTCDFRPYEPVSQHCKANT